MPALLPSTDPITIAGPACQGRAARKDSLKIGADGMICVPTAAAGCGGIACAGRAGGQGAWVLAPSDHDCSGMYISAQVLLGKVCPQLVGYLAMAEGTSGAHCRVDQRSCAWDLGALGTRRRPCSPAPLLALRYAPSSLLRGAAPGAALREVAIQVGGPHGAVRREGARRQALVVRGLLRHAGRHVQAF